jgi:hypothetical protein
MAATLASSVTGIANTMFSTSWVTMLRWSIGMLTPLRHPAVPLLDHLTGMCRLDEALVCSQNSLDRQIKMTDDQFHDTGVGRQSKVTDGLDSPFEVDISRSDLVWSATGSGPQSLTSQPGIPESP